MVCLLVAGALVFGWFGLDRPDRSELALRSDPRKANDRASWAACPPLPSPARAGKPPMAPVSDDKPPIVAVSDDKPPMAPVSVDEARPPSAFDVPAPSETTRPNERPQANPVAPSVEVAATRLSPENGSTTGAFRAAATLVRRAMAGRDLADARRWLAKANQVAQTDVDRTEAARLETMIGHLDTFWREVRRGMAGLRGGTELTVPGGRVVMVVESSADELTLRDEGRNRTFQPGTMPAGLAYLIAQRSLADNPENKVLLGVFLVIGPDGNRDRARTLWQEAQSAGQDVADLLPELSSPFASRK